MNEINTIIKNKKLNDAGKSLAFQNIAISAWWNFDYQKAIEYFEWAKNFSTDNLDTKHLDEYISNVYKDYEGDM